jgi:hypothetical protein
VSVLGGRSRCLGMHPAVHRGRFTIVPPAETSNMPQKRQVWKRVSRVEELRVSVLAGRSRCLRMHPAVHRGRFTIVPPTETSNMPENRQVWKRVSREEGAADRRSSRSVALPGHAPGDPSRQIHDRLTHRNVQRAAETPSVETGFGREGEGEPR